MVRIWTCGHGSGEAVDGGHRVHPAYEQRQPLLGHRIGPHEVRGRVEVQKVGSLSDTTGRQVVSPARRQVDGTVAHPPHDAVGRQASQDVADGRVRLAQDEGQIH